MSNFAVLATVLLVIQMLLSFLQVRYYSGFVRKIAKKFANQSGCTLKTQVAKGILKSTIILVVTDQEDKIVEVYEYAGMTVLSRFKRKDEFIGQILNHQFLSQLDPKRVSKQRRNAFEKLVTN